MKYFTPQLFVRLQNIRDDTAIQAWDRAVSDYSAALAEALPRFPKNLQHIVKKVALHDADVRSMAQLGNVLSITVQTDPPGPELYILSYTLTEPPRINRSALPREHCTDHATWLYDEFLLAEPSTGLPNSLKRTNRDGGAAGVGVYTHDILLSNGWEVSLKFRKFKFSHPIALLPASCMEGEDREAALTRSA